MKRIFTLFISLVFICIAKIGYSQVPVVTGGQTFSINENSAVATAVGTASASNSPTSWAITTNTTNNAFAISNTGQITVSNVTDLDREATASLSIMVTATNGSGTSTPPVSITINLNDVNEFTPVVTAAQSFSINENLANGNNVGTPLIATDGDATAAFSGWALTSNPGGAFAINAASGQLTVATASYLDREARSSVVVAVTVSDGTNTSASQNVTINLNDVNEFTPAVTAAQSFSINENLANGNNVGTPLVATDGDATAALSGWALTSNPGGAFAINAASGQLTVATSSYLDFEARTNIVIAVTVSDGTNTSAPQNVTINLNDMNEFTPVVTAAQSFSINENLANGNNVGTPLIATDGDATAAFSGWALTSNPGGAFAINAASGQLTVATSSYLDFEARTNIVIAVTVSDGTNTSASQNVTINLNDVNEFTPAVTAAQSFSINENLANGNNVGTPLVATDGDATAALSGWALTSNPGGAFAINAASGQLTVATSSYLDFEARTNIVIAVTVSDGTNTSAPQNVTINLNDLDEIPPTISSVSASATASILKLGDQITFTATIATPEMGLIFSPLTYNGRTLSPTWATSNGGTTYTATYTVVTGDDRASTLQLSNVIATDAAGNPSSPVSTSNVTYTAIDATVPATPAITLTPTVYFNLANTSIDFTVPIASAGTDPSLAGGNIQLQIDNQTNSGFVALGGLVSIALADQGTSKLISIPLATLTSAPANTRYADGNTIKFRAIIHDGPGNTTTTATLGTQLIVDRTAPAQPTTLTLVDDTGSSPTDRITNDLTPRFSAGSIEVGATLRIYSTAEGAPPVGTQAYTGATTTVNTTLTVQNNTANNHTITAIQTDAAGNPSVASSGLQISMDATKPSVSSSILEPDNSTAAWKHNFSCSGTTTDRTTSTEFFHLTLSEPLAIPDGTQVTIAMANGFSVDRDGAAATYVQDIASFDVDCSADGDGHWRGASVYHSTGNIIHLKSNADGLWTGATTLYFTSIGTSNLKDAAGNELGSIGGITPPDTAPPYISSGLIFNPNGSSAESITFNISEGLNASVGTAPTGFTVNQPAPGTVASAFYNSALGTITLTSPADGQWTDAIQVSYAPGNILDPAPGNNPMVAISNLQIRLVSVNISSNNANGFTARAKNSDDITVSFNPTTPLTGPPTVTIGGQPAVNVLTGPVTYSAKVTASALLSPEGSPLPFTINAVSASDEVDVTATTNSSQVIYDKTSPVISAITISSNNAISSSLAKISNTVTLLFTVNEALFGTPSVTIGGRSASVSNVGLNYTATLVLNGTEPTGVLAFNISLQDQVGNSASASAITSGSNVTYDKTNPTITSIKIVAPPTPNGWSGTNGTSATTLTYRVLFSENVTGISYAGGNKNFSEVSDGSISAPNPTGPSFTTSNYVDITVTGISGQGRIRYDFTENDNIIDAVGNPVGGVGNSTLTTSFGPVPNDEYYTRVLPEPFIDPSFSVSATTVTSNSITVTWTPNGTAQTPTHYLVLASTGTPPVPVDGTTIPDGALAHNVPFGTNSWTFGPTPPLNSGTVYNFAVYKYTLSANNSPDNIDYELTEPALLNGTETSTASLGKIDLNSAPVSIESIKNSNLNSKTVMQFTISDDEWTPIVQDVMTLHLNDLSQETVTFNVGESLTLAEGAAVTGFSSSSGSVASGFYSGKGSTNTITLTSNAHGAWTSGTTISYSSGSGNVQFQTRGPLQNISAHTVVQVTDVVQTFSSSGTFNVPAGVTKFQVETWGAGGSAGGSFAITPGTWTLQLFDSFAGFEGSLVDVYVNGGLVISNAGSTLTGSGQTQNFTFSVPAGATVFVDYSYNTLNCCQGENTLRLFDASGTLLRQWFGAASNTAVDYTQTVSSPGGGGGGGGAYSRSLVTVTSGSYNYVVGNGGTSIPAGVNTNGNPGGSTSFGGGLVVAQGGNGGSASNIFSPAPGGLGGQPASGTGDVKWPGGTGGFGSTGGSGGAGGSSAGTGSGGNTGANGPGCFDNTYCYANNTAAVPGGGDGGWGLNHFHILNGYGHTGPAPIDGDAPGGGGGGISGNLLSSALGANGQVRITYSLPASSATTPYAADNSPFKFKGLVISQGTGNDIADWRNIIAGAELFDGTNTHTGAVNATDGSTIIFTGIPASSATTDVGFITDASTGPSSKTYSLKIWLKPNLSDALAATVDGMNLAFTVDPANLTYDDNTNGNQKSSRLVPTHTALSSGAKEITVDATELKFHAPGSTSPTVTEPQNSIGVGTQFSTNLGAIGPIVYALDVNNNLDKDFVQSGTVDNPPGPNLAPSIGAQNFIAGALDIRPLKFDAAGINNLRVQSTGVATATSLTPVTVVTTSLTTIAGSSTVDESLVNLSSLRTALTGATPPQQDAVANFDFTIADDVGANSATFDNNDALPTLFDQIIITQGGGTDAALQGKWDLVIAGAELSLTATTGSQTGLPLAVATQANSVVGANNITFSGISGAVGRVDDGKVNTYTLKIFLKKPIDPSLRDIVDKKGFEFVIVNTSINPAGTANTSSVIAASNTTSGAANNKIEVTAGQLDFILQPSANQYYDANITPPATLKARDANQNLDTDFGFAVNNMTLGGDLVIPDGRTYPIINGTGMNFASGQVTLNSNLRVSSSGNGIEGDQTYLNVISNGVSGNSQTITMHYDNVSDITKDPNFNTGNSSYAKNILYKDYQAATFTANSDGVALERFLLRDGGGTNDLDGSPTVLQSITLNIDNWKFLRTIALYNGTNKIAERAVAGNINTGTGDLSFPTLATAFVTATDFTNTPITVYATFNSANAVDAAPFDNQVVRVQVASATTAPVSSRFPVVGTSTTFAGLSTNENKIEVVATQIDFTTVPANASISVPMTIKVSARDLHQNVDLDYNGSITGTGYTPAIPLNPFHTLNDPTGAFGAAIPPDLAPAPGTKDYPSTFQFDIGDGVVQLTISSGAASTAGESSDAGVISGTSPNISVISSYESQLVSDNVNFGAAGLTQDIDFINYQATNITTTSPTTTNGFILDLMYLYDGGQSDNTDLDGAPTSLKDLTLGLSNHQSIRRIAIYTKDPSTGNVSEIKDYDITDPALSPTTVNGYRTITFTNLNIVAPDDSYNQILVLATFQGTPTTITDRDDIKIAVLAATLNIGSKFAPDAAETGTIGGVATSTFTFPEAIASATVGTLGYLSKLQVTATSLDFEDDTFTLKQPSALAGEQEPIDGSPGTSPGGNTGIVYARDKFGIIDTDFVSAATVSAGANPISYPAVFINGVLDLVGMQYQTSGDGTLKVTAGGLDSSVPGVGNIGNSTPSATVDVIHVKAIHDTNTVELLQSLKGGTTNKRIFGFDFSADHSTATEPSLTGFSITFKDDNGDPYPYTKSLTDNIFKNFKLYYAEGTGAPTALTEGADYTLTQDQSVALTQVIPTPPASYKDRLTFVLTNPVPLYQFNYRFYLNVDVDVSVSVGTAPITPYLEDQGYSFSTNDHIKTTVGSATANVQGITRKFASTKPPVLVYTSPGNGKLNVDLGLNTITLKFDVPVATFDGEIKVYNRETGTLRAVFTSTNGKYVDGIPLKDQVVPFLDFAAPPGFDFQPDTVYYVTVEKGVFSNTDVTQRKGISDEGFNLYGGIAYSGTFYFKGSSLLAPKLISTDATKYYYTPTSATFNFKFDKPGKVHYLVLHPTLPSIAPTTITNAQIDGTDNSLDGNLVARGVTVIDQQSPNLQFTTINAALTNDIDYFVYAYSENDAEPIPVKTGAPNGAYGSYIADANFTNDYVVGNPGPTFKIKKTSSNTNAVNNPRFEICVNSSVKMEEPIIISETVAGGFSAGFTGGGTQTFNLLLPTGFQFDVTKTPTITFNGPDFGSLPGGTNVYRYRNTALLEINFVNATSTPINLDNIIISDLYLIASSADISGNIIRFGGTGLTAVPDDRILARITSGAATSIPFTNSYDEANNPWPYTQISGANPYKPITYIPDNFANTVRLIPVAPTGDYGSSFFTGAGLTNDELTLSAVAPDASFNISLTHTDQTGCATTTTEQYLVYDHTKTIPELLKVTLPGVSYNITGTKIGLIPGTPDPVTNIPGLPSATLNVNDLVRFDGLAGYQLIDLYADIPVRVKNLPNPQVLDYNDPGWNALVNNIPKLKSSFVDANLGQTFKTYNWEYSDLINKSSTTAAGVEYPYDPAGRFSRTVQSEGTGNGKTYFEPGSLGIIEFTGVYQSTADYSVFIPFRQEIELFIPAVPVVEVNGESSKAGATPIFCESGLPFIVTGYPLANSSEVTGYFTLRDSLTSAVITDAGFVDNGNGTASFNPSSTILKNGYKTIKVEYTFKQNNSPAIGTGALYIRVTPNPVANFTTSTLCEDLDVKFTDTTLDPIPGQVTVKQWAWSFGDPSSAQNSDVVQNPIHKYVDSGLFTPVTLNVTTNFGCVSVVPKSASLQIGGTPVVAFGFLGVSVNDQIQFTNKSTVSANDAFGQLDWTFGDGGSQAVTTNFTAPLNHSYTLPNSYDVNLKVTSAIGCVNNLTQRIVVLSNAIPTSTASYVENFENVNAMWQSSSLPTSSFATNPTSWAIGAPSGSVITITDPSTFGSKVAKTNLTGNYNPLENSALYSPSFDLSQLQRPMVSYNSFVQMEVGDGVILQYSVDNKNVADPTKVWNVLGDNLNEGVDWFNTSGITAKPGNQPDKDFGWSGFDKVRWLESKHTISNSTIPSKDKIEGKSQVVFRFALASAKQGAIDITHEGFAIDNFRIGERTRTILLENFTTTNGKDNALIKAENEFVTSFIAGGLGTTVVKLNYHIGFTGTDPFNSDDPADPSARALYYNVKEVPWAFLDGNRSSDANIDSKFSSWGQKAYDAQTLQLGQANIVVPTPSVNSDGSIKFDVQVTALYDLPDTTILHVAVIEQSIVGSSLSSTQQSQIKTGESTFDFVLKKMLPNATGTKFGTVLPKNSTRTFTGFEYYPDASKLYTNKDDLAIIVFLQNESRKGIYQTELITGISDPSVVTGMENAELLEHLEVYPNPADNEIIVRLPGVAKESMELQLVDQMGKVVIKDSVHEGTSHKTINSQSLAAGIYILQVGSGKAGVARKKVLVVHQE